MNYQVQYVRNRYGFVPTVHHDRHFFSLSNARIEAKHDRGYVVDLYTHKIVADYRWPARLLRWLRSILNGEIFLPNWQREGR